MAPNTTPATTTSASTAAGHTTAAAAADVASSSSTLRSSAARAGGDDEFRRRRVPGGGGGEDDGAEEMLRKEDKVTIAPFSTVSSFAESADSFSVKPYYLIFILPVACYISIQLGGYWHGLVTGLAFLLLPVLDFFFDELSMNPTPEQEKIMEAQLKYRVPVLLWVPTHIALVLYSCYTAATAPEGSMSTGEWIGFVLSTGFVSGLGVNVAHELGHKRTFIEPLFAQICLLFSGYMHFHVEHIQGHHHRVATPEDPATARRNQSIYAFWWQSVKGSYVSACKLEAEKAKRAGKSPYNPLHNVMILYTLAPMLLCGALYYVLGWKAALFYIGQSFISISLLEIVNYVEHYGLERVKLPNGQWERVRPIHSWNANMKVSNFLLFKLQRHSDHHAYPYRRYQILRSFDESPNFPAGYTVMVLLALVPPVFFAVMHPRLDAHMQGINAIRQQLNLEDLRKG